MNKKDLGMWHQYVNIDGNDFWGVDGWPCDFDASRFGEGLTAAIAALPGAASLDSENGEIEGLARALFCSFEDGLSEKMPRNQPATGKATGMQLRKLHKLMGDLSDHLSVLNKPALEALELENFQFRKLNDLVTEQHEIIRYAFGLVDPNLARGSAETKIVARTVCEGAAQVFEYVTKKTATYSTDVGTSKRSGDWPSFLGLVFKTLRIHASVESQVAAFSKKRNEKTAF